MSDDSLIDRRRVLAWSAAAATLGAWPGFGRATALAQGLAASPVAAFTVDIPGLTRKARNITDVIVFETRIGASGLTDTGARVPVRQPGRIEYPNLRLTSLVDPPGSGEFRAWFDDAATGKGIRKNITVTLFDKEGEPVRSFTLVDCFPVAYSQGSFDTSSTVQTETITVKVGRIEFKV